MIKLENVSKYFGNIRAVDDVSFEIKQGDVVGFLGPNGAGKSTTMRILTGIISPNKGSIQIAGLDPFEEPIKVRSKIGYLPEINPLYPDMTVKEYLNFAVNIKNISKPDKGDSINKVVEECSIANIYNKVIATLSKGYRQRVGLAQALIGDPDILLLDEPTSGLDPAQIIEIRDLIRSFSKEKTIMLSTHILQEIQAVCSRLLIINNGKIVADGDIATLRKIIKGEVIIKTIISGDEEPLNRAFKENSKIDSFELTLKDPDNKLHYKIKPSSNENAAEEIFQIAKMQNFVVSELKTEEASLEDIFLKLTARNGE